MTGIYRNVVISLLTMAVAVVVVLVAQWLSLPIEYFILVLVCRLFIEDLISAGSKVDGPGLGKRDTL